MPIKKNPVSLLQEISVRRRYIMRDTLLEEHGEGHEKKFEILLVLDGSPGCLTGTATASSKSEAKKLAAVDILKKVIKLDDLKLKENEKEEIVNVLLSEDDSRELECPVDYIADLERKVTLKGLPTPIYNLVSQGGPPHQRTFVIQCKIGDEFDTVGVAGQKKAAKRDAAGKMLKKIEDASEKLMGVADQCVAGQKKAAKRDAAGKMLKKIEDASEKLMGVADQCVAGQKKA
ncbi:interferon-inducible double-stranded RNA-dependent protein kinase activator A homolog A-like, partial [Artemia franciscana]|uniref:interferon-inducible double-stranded RNA-dependent protein kinase activator A homolog A-like n=1 Tax=Artemia franciscana TaxID=6661 RepID=UPI0032DA1EB7